MKRNLLFICTIFLTITTYSQQFDTLYYTKFDKKSNKIDYDYFQVIKKITNQQYDVIDYYKDDSLKNTSSYILKNEIEITNKNFKKFVKKKKLLLDGSYFTYKHGNIENFEIKYNNGEIIYGPVEYVDGDTVYMNPQVKSKFSNFGSNDYSDFRNFVTSKLKYPEFAIKQNIQGRVFITFIVNKEGLIKHIKVLKSAHPLLDAEAIRAIKTSPSWIPAQENNKNVSSIFVIPVTFKFQ